MPSRVPPGTRPTPAIAILLMLRVQPPFAWKLELLGRKRVRVEFVASTCESDVETQDGEQNPPPPVRVSFPRPITMASGFQLKEGEQLLSLYMYRLRGGVMGNWSARCGGGRGWLRDSWFGTGCSRSRG